MKPLVRRTAHGRSNDAALLLPPKGMSARAVICLPYNKVHMRLPYKSIKENSLELTIRFKLNNITIIFFIFENQAFIIKHTHISSCIFENFHHLVNLLCSRSRFFYLFISTENI